MSNMRSLLKKVKKQVSSEEATRAWEKKEEEIGKENKEVIIRNAHLPRTRRSRTVSEQVLAVSLPNLRDANPATRSRLLIRKLRLCSYVFEFSETPDTPVEAKRKEIKRSALLELVNYLTVFKPSFNEEELKEIFEMLSCNLFRALPPSTHDLMGVYNPEEDEPQSEPTWPHLQVVYEFLLRLASSKETDPKLMDKYFSREFVASLLQLFDSEDPRERDYLKTILHRVYGNFMALRPFIRRAINNVFYSYIYETDRHNGIAELLEILGSIINGFALPLKDQHKVFLQRVLLPLHKVTYIGVFHPQLSYCVTQFLEKDATLAPRIVNALLKYWPVTCSKKELMFLNELEEILDRVQPQHLGATQVPLFRQVARSINSSHFQVSERAIYVLNNDVILRFITNNRETLIPILGKALYANTHLHRRLEAMRAAGEVPDNPAGENPKPDRPTPASPRPAIIAEAKAAAAAAASAPSAPGVERAVLAHASSSLIDSKVDKATKQLARQPVVVSLPGEGVEVSQKWEELGHWNEAIVELTADILKLFNEMDPVLMTRCSKQYDTRIKTRLENIAKKKVVWNSLAKAFPSFASSLPPIASFSSSSALSPSVSSVSSSSSISSPSSVEAQSPISSPSPDA